MALTTTDYRGNKIRLIQKKWQSLSVALNDDKYSDEFKEALDEDIEEVEKEMYF